MDLGAIWNLVVMSPVINVLVVLTRYLLGSFGLAIIALTLIIRLLTLPLTLQQLRSTKAIQTLQPKLAELQKKYARDRQKLAQEQMRMYKESGISPVGCMVPMLVQLPVWIALFQAIVRVLAVVPEDFLNLSQHLYRSWSVFSLVPLNSKFLWLDLAKPDSIIILPILVGGTMWVQQKMVTAPAMDPRQESQNRLMLWMMPLMFAFFTLQFPSGLALYWVVSNLFSIVVQYYVTGLGGLAPAAPAPSAKEKGVTFAKRIETVEQKPSADVSAESPPTITEQKGGPFSIFRRMRGQERQQHKKK